MFIPVCDCILKCRIGKHTIPFPYTVFVAGLVFRDTKHHRSHNPCEVSETLHKNQTLSKILQCHWWQH